MPRIHGTRRIHEVTGGHEEDPIRLQEEPRGHHRTREDTPLRRFGTVRPPGSSPGPPTSLLNSNSVPTTYPDAILALEITDLLEPQRRTHTHRIRFAECLGLVDFLAASST